MKKLLVVLLSLGLIVAFSTAASAVDVKFSGGYYVVGVYDNNPQFLDQSSYSRAAFFTRTRVQNVFEIAEGLSMTVRFDALEKQWGQTDMRSITASDVDKTNSRKYRSNTTTNVQENLELERGFITFKTAIGQFDVGYQLADKWGTDFGDSESTKPRVKFVTKSGPVILLAVYEKGFESDTSVVPGYSNGQAGGKTDADNDNYYLAGIFNFKGGEAGLLYKYGAANSNRPTSAFKTAAMGLAPYFKVTVGPVYVEGEAAYAFGKYMKFDDNVPGAKDVDYSTWMGYLKARMNVGPAYFGGQVGYVKGDGDDATKYTGPISAYGGGYDWKPTLILNNVDYNTWLPNGSDSSNPYHDNSKGFFIYNAFVGFNPTPKLNVEASVSVAQYDAKKTWNAARTAQTEIVSDKIGTEIDMTATYKIYDNLSYMVGGGYIFAGDAWKGTSATAQVGNTYMLINKLTLSF
jgi:hypothetical protein